MKKQFSYDLCRVKMWTVQIGDQTVRSVQSDLDLHCPHKFPVSSTLRKDFTLYARYGYELNPLLQAHNFFHFILHR